MRKDVRHAHPHLQTRGAQAPGGWNGCRPGPRHDAGTRGRICGGGSFLAASASEQEAPAPQLPAGSAVNDNQEADGAAPAADDAPEASAQSADAKAASGSAGPGTTVSIQVYRSSYPLVWDLNDAGSADATKAQWGNKPAAWPTEGSPGSAVGKCDGYVAWTDDANPGSEPSRLGFNFMGWSTKPDIAVEGTGKLDTLTLPKDAPIVEGDDGVKRITLYALWAPVEYSVVFDLTKNPEDATAVPSFSWTTGKGTFSDLGGGRYRLSGVTLEDYDPATGLIEIATPARGTGGYRFLSWAEPESQQDPAVAVMKPGSAKWFVNPVALPHYEYEPVLTARWALSFDVDVPSQVTFDQYDSLEVEGNLTDTTSKDAIDEESSDLHDKGKLAHFCSQSTASDYKIVALKSVKQPTAEKVLTTSDSSKASPEEVLGGTDGKGVEHEGEKLLSLFAAGATSESQGVHFRLDDAIDMDDSARYGAFTIPKQTKAYADADYSRDDEERLYVSYRLNLDNKVDGATEPNHGLVVPENVQEGDRTPIAEVSYEFAVADAEVETVKEDYSFYIEDGAVTYGLHYIKKAADDLAQHGASSSYFNQFNTYLAQDKPFKLRMGDAVIDVSLIGISQDYIANPDTAEGTTTPTRSKKKAGLSFMLSEIYALNGLTNSSLGSTPFDNSMNAVDNYAGGWGSSSLRGRLNGDFLSALPPTLRNELLTVAKCQQGGQSDKTVHWTKDRIFILSEFEVLGATVAGMNNHENKENSFQYQTFGKDIGRLVRTYNGAPNYWWTRSARVKYDSRDRICRIPPKVGLYDHDDYPRETRDGVVPCFCL